jgi:hypothetical protein
MRMKPSGRAGNSFVILLSMLLAGAATVARAQLNVDEYRVKAAFLFHFAQLVDWPANTLTGADNSLVLRDLHQEYAGPDLTVLPSLVRRSAFARLTWRF